MDGKISFRGKTSHIIFSIVFLVEHGMKKTKDKKLRTFLAENQKLLILTFSISWICSLMCGTWIGPNRAPTQNQPIFRVTDYTNGSPHVHLIQQRRNRSLDRCANKLFLLSNDNGKWKSWNRFLRSKDEIITIYNHEKIV